MIEMDLCDPNLPRVKPSLVHCTRPARSPITQLIIARPPSGTKESCGVVRKNCCLDPSQPIAETRKLFSSSHCSLSFTARMGAKLRNSLKVSEVGVRQATGMQFTYLLICWKWICLIEIPLLLLHYCKMQIIFANLFIFNSAEAKSIIVQ